MAMKGYVTLLSSLKLKLHYQIQFSVNSETRTFFFDEEV